MRNTTKRQFINRRTLIILSIAVFFSTFITNAQLNIGAKDRTPYTVGPGGGGRLIYPAINPLNDDNIMLTVDMAASFISTNGGEWFHEKEFTGQARFSFNPHDRNTVYAYTKYIYISTDGGQTFDHLYPSKDNIRYSETNPNGTYNAFNDMVYDLINPALQSPHTVLAVAVHPTNAKNIFFLTAGGEKPEIHKSTNGGKTWTLFAQLPGGQIKQALSSESSDGRFDAYGRMIVLSNGGLLVMANTGIYRVNANGATVVISEKKSKDGDIIYDAANSRATYYMLEKLGASDHPSFADQIIKSTDGANWTPISHTFTERIETPANSGKRKLDFMAVHDNSTIYVAYESAVWTNIGVARTTDGGSTWQIILRSGAIPDNITNVGAMDRLSGFLGWTGIGQGITVSKTNPDLMMVTNMSDAYLTKDGGAHWDALSSRDNADGTYTTRGIDPAGPAGIAFDPHNTQHAYIPHADIGLWETQDGGQSWKRQTAGASVASEWSNTCTKVAFDPVIKDLIITAWNGDHSSRAYADWILYGMRARPAWFNTTGGITISHDGGKTWTASGAYIGDGMGFDETINANNLPKHANDPRNSGLPTHCIATDIFIDPNSPPDPSLRHIYVTSVGYGVYRSIDGGQTFLPFNRGMEGEASLVPFLFAAKPDGTELYVTFHPELEGYTGNPIANQGAIYHLDMRNTSAGWKKIPTPQGESNREPGMRIAIDISVDSNGILYCAGRACSASNWKRAQFSGVWLTSDYGETWKNIFPQDVTTRSIHVDSRNPNLIYIGTSRREVWASNKGPATTFTDWIEIKGIQHPKTTSVDEDPNDPSRIYAGTACGGLWRLTLPISLTGNATPPTVTYPGLTLRLDRASGILHIQSPSGSAIDAVEIFDPAGRRVYTSANMYGDDLSIDISTLPKGLYIVRAGGAAGKVVKD